MSKIPITKWKMKGRDLLFLSKYENLRDIIRVKYKKIHRATWSDSLKGRGFRLISSHYWSNCIMLGKDYG